MAIRPSSRVPDPVLRQISKPVETVDEELRDARRRHVRDDVRRARHRPRRDPGRRAQAHAGDRPAGARGRGRASRSRTRGCSSTPRSSWHSRPAKCPTPRAACRCPTNMPRSMRPDRIRARWLDVDGKAHEEEIDGLLAVCLQHEMDHLERRAVHRPSVAPEARDGPQEARQAAERAAEGGLIGRRDGSRALSRPYLLFRRRAPCRRARCATTSLADPAILFVGRMTDRGVGPHPIPQYRNSFSRSARGRRHRGDRGLRPARAGPPADRRRPRRPHDAWPLDRRAARARSHACSTRPGTTRASPRFGKSDF